MSAINKDRCRLVLAVHRRDLREVQAPGDRDHGRIDDAEGKRMLVGRAVTGLDVR